MSQKNVLFQIRARGTEYMVCRQAFCSIHGITRHRANRIGLTLKEKIAAPLDMRGKHNNRPNKISQNIIATIDNHILSFPKRSSHYSREKNERRNYLSSDLNVSKMHKLYLAKYEPDLFEKLERGEKCQPKVSYDFYFRHFRENYNISFGSPRSDTCQTCDRLENLIAAEPDREAKHVLQTEKTLHIRKAEVFYTSMKEKTQLAKTDVTVEVLCFDYQQNLPLPHVPAGDVFYKRQLWQYNFCIFSGKTGLSTFYMYDEATSKKSSNEVISFLHHYIMTFLSDSVTTLYLFSDNSFAQNKNHTITKYLFTLVNQRIKNIGQVIHQYPEPGHSFLPCDRSFGLIEKEKRRKERVYVPAEWKELVRKTSKKFRVIDVTQDIIMDFREHFKPIFKATFTSQNIKMKFSISTFRVFKYETGSNFIECSTTASLPVFTKFSATKFRCILSLPATKMTQIYPLPINEKKVADVKLLVKKYVPEAYQHYYRRIFGEVGEEPEPQLPEEEVDAREEPLEDAAFESDSSFM